MVSFDGYHSLRSETCFTTAYNVNSSRPKRSAQPYLCMRRGRARRLKVIQWRIRATRKCSRGGYHSLVCKVLYFPSGSTSRLGIVQSSFDSYPDSYSKPPARTQPAPDFSGDSSTEPSGSPFVGSLAASLRMLPPSSLSSS